MFKDFFETNTYLKGGCVAILLSVLGSGLYDLIKPLAGNGYILLLNIGTLGLSELQNGLYIGIAKGLHENTSLRLFFLINGLFLGFIIITLLIAKRIRDRLMNGNEETEIESGKRERLFRGRYFLPGIFTYFLFACSVFALSTIKELYINRAITYHNQILTISRPYISEEDHIRLRSNFAQINDKNSYILQIEEILKILREKELTAPEFKTIF